MSKMKISSYFRRESEVDETIKKAEEKTENDFTRRKMMLDFRIQNLATSRRNS